MRRFTFTPEDLVAFRHERYYHPHPRIQQKMEVLWLKSRGLTHEDIARLADVSRRSVQRYLDEFADGGLERAASSALERAAQRTRRPPVLPGRLLPGEPAAFNPRSPGGYRTANGRPSGADPGPRLLKKTLGLRWRKVGTIPAKADPQEQADFLKNKLRPRLRQAERGQRTVLFVDAAHFVFGPFLGFLWCLVRLFVPGPVGPPTL